MEGTVNAVSDNLKKMGREAGKRRDAKLSGKVSTGTKNETEQSAVEDDVAASDLENSANRIEKP
jgi:hypothetical protein